MPGGDRWPQPSLLGNAGQPPFGSASRARWQRIEQRVRDDWPTRRAAIERRYRSAIVLCLVGASCALAWPPALAFGHTAAGAICAAGTLASLIALLQYTARMAQLQTGEDVAFVHLQTSLTVFFGVVVPLLGSFMLARLAARLFRGRLPRSSGLHRVRQSPRSQTCR